MCDGTVIELLVFDVYHVNKRCIQGAYLPGRLILCQVLQKQERVSRTEDWPGYLLFLLNLW